MINVGGWTTRTSTQQGDDGRRDVVLTIERRTTVSPQPWKLLEDLMLIGAVFVLMFVACFLGLTCELELRANLTTSAVIGALVALLTAGWLVSGYRKLRHENREAEEHPHRFLRVVLSPTAMLEQRGHVHMGRDVVDSSHAYDLCEVREVEVIEDDGRELVLRKHYGGTRFMLWVEEAEGAFLAEQINGYFGWPGTSADAVARRPADG